jgi:hypothetical protein
MAAAARISAAAAGFADIRQAHLQLARQWMVLARQAESFPPSFLPEAENSTICFCAMLLLGEFNSSSQE